MTKITNKTGDSERLILRPVVEHRTGLATSTLYERISAGDFPRPVRLTPRRVAWIEREVDDWIAARIAASRVEAA